VPKSVHLCQLTTFRIGGTPARYYHPRTCAELEEALAECRADGLPWRVFGGGSNLLVDEGRLPYAVIRIHAPGLDGIERTGPALVRVGAGVPTGRLLTWCRDEGLGGLEFMAGLPGTMGGAVAGNAGAWGEETCGLVTRLHVVSPRGETWVLARRGLRYSYRCAELGGAIITAVELELSPRSPQLIALRMREHALVRAERHPMRDWSAGCVFKNPPGLSAGKLLDLCGTKGWRVGDAEVSRLHANFIINRGSADADDVLRLIELMRTAVRREFGIDLELEVRHWPARLQAA
jgi:UDP-N-acetylmuramate dehydrogenase